MRKVLLFLLCVLLALSLSSCDRLKIYWLSIQAESSYNQGNADKAIRLYRKIIVSDPKNVKAHYYLGLSYFSKGNKYGTLRQVSELRKINKNDLADQLEKLVEEKLPFQYQ